MSVGSAGRGKLLIISGLLLLMLLVPATAMWSTDLRINVSVSTGSVDPRIYLFKGFIVEECCCGCLPRKFKIIPLKPNELYLSDDGNYLILQLSPRCDHHHDKTHKVGNSTFTEARGGRCEHHEHVVIGIIVKNYGTIPIKLWGVRVFELSSDNGEWSYRAFYYGPLPRIPPFWGTLTKGMASPPGSRPTPITLDPGRMAVIIVVINIDKKSSYDLGIRPTFTQFNRSSR